MTGTENNTERSRWVYQVPERNFAKLGEQFDKFTRRARKNHLTPPCFEVIWETDEKKIQKVPDSDLDPYGVLGICRDEEVWTRYYYIVVEGERPVVSGWTFVCTIDHTEQEASRLGNILKSVPGTGNIPTKYRTALPDCDHCRVKRRRNETFIIRNDAGDFRQIGRQCVSDFFPGCSPSDVATNMEWWTEAGELLEGAYDDDFFGSGWGRGYDRLGIENVLRATQAIIEIYGWRSRTMAREDGPWGQSATADLVHKLFNPPRPTTKEYTEFVAEIQHRLKTRQSEITQTVSDALEWIRSIEPDTAEDYLFNLWTICRGETVREDRLGLACSLMSAYRRHVDGERRKKEIAERPASEYVGETGKRALIHGCECKFVGEPQQSDYGFNRTVSVFRFILFLRGGKDAIVWYANGDAGLDFKVGEVYDLVCTPKKHEEKEDRKWGRQKRTVVNRVVVADDRDRKNKKLIVI